jgi:hypothetical protein
VPPEAINLPNLSTMPILCRFFYSLVLTITTMSAATAAPPGDPSGLDAIALRIGDNTMSAAEYRTLAAAMEESSGSKSFGENPNLLRQYAEIAILADSARKQGLDQDGIVAAKVRIASDEVLARAERERLFQSAAVTDVDIKRRFESQPGAYDEYNLSHIFIAFDPPGGGKRRSEHQTLARARQLKTRLDAGADFARVARVDSDDRSTAHEGGRLPATLGMFLANEFAPAIHRLHVGEVSEPVRGPDGYHLILLQEHMVATLEGRRKMIEALLRDEAVDSGVGELVRTHQTLFNPTALGGVAAR